MELVTPATNLFLTILGSEKFRMKAVANSVSGAGLVHIMPVFSLYHLVAERARELSVTSFLKALILFIRSVSTLMTCSPPKGLPS